jgi:hypothetical protein
VLRSLLVDDKKSLVKKTQDIDLELKQQKEKIIEYN